MRQDKVSPGENFSRAAEELAMTQAGVSYQIKLLEERLGARLFARAGRNMALTALGRREKMLLLEKRIVLCSELIGNTRALAEAGVTGSKATAALEEAGTLCAGKAKVE